MTEANRRCNDLELNRLQRAVHHAIVDVLAHLNGMDSVQVTKAEIAPDPLPNSRGCTLNVSLFVYAPKSEDPS